jgi:hypothetical protein
MTIIKDCDTCKYGDLPSTTDPCNKCCSCQSLPYEYYEPIRTELNQNEPKEGVENG